MASSSLNHRDDTAARFIPVIGPTGPAPDLNDDAVTIAGASAAGGDGGNGSSQGNAGAAGALGKKQSFE